MARRKKPTPCVSYLRVSSRGQVGKGGIPRQRERIAAYAKRKGFTIIEEFVDRGVSGTRGLLDRPGLSQLLDRVTHNAVKIVLLENPDRLARDLTEGELILKEFRDAEIKVIAVEGDIDLTPGSDDPNATLIRQILGSIAEWDKNTLVAKLRAARLRKKRETGVCEGKKRFGHYSGESETLTRLRELRKKPRGRKRMPYAAIADILNREGRAPRTGDSWTGAKVQGILRTIAG